MTTEEKARALVDAVWSEYPLVADFQAVGIALCRAIEQHEAFRQEVSDIVHHYVYADGGPDDWEKLKALIIPAPKHDPMSEVWRELFANEYNLYEFVAALEARGLEIREKGNE